MPTPYEEDLDRLRKLLSEVETDEDSDFYNEDNGPEDGLEENFSDHECFSEHDKESEKDGSSGNEVKISEGFISNDGVYTVGKENLGRIFVLVVVILYHA
ncbi:hypothetical protein AVEN_187705-1 [Araneus ventricosus]|uniref:Uncharacterized protein n=1 Tax=Araneus ventricosus TaxID=182803 RepID=A0A4Y2C2L8_ARAVE|nr:hypothetical protein AVEN_187705-1 [Araneus ventricosus]